MRMIKLSDIFKDHNNFIDIEVAIAILNEERRKLENLAVEDTWKRLKDFPAPPIELDPRVNHLSGFETIVNTDPCCTEDDQDEYGK